MTIGSDWLASLGVQHPVVQAGMGGGIVRAPLAAAVSEAGGLGTLGLASPRALAAELRAARERTRKPIAVNLLLPFVRPAHADAIRQADVVVTFWGRPRRLSDRPWAHQCGSVAEARAAHAAGADAVIAQGVEAGGHVRGTTPAHALLQEIRSALSPSFPVLLAGGLADASDVRRALDAGAAGAVLGTRFLLTPESGAHPAYVQRLIDGSETVLTELFGQGWPAAHRVIHNGATRHWLCGSERGPRWIRSLNRAGAPLMGRVPIAWHGRVAAVQRPWMPLLSPQPLHAGMPAHLVDATPLYAGQSVARLHDVRPAGELVRELTGAAAPR